MRQKYGLKPLSKMGSCAREHICAPFMLVVNEISTHESLTAVPHPTHTHTPWHNTVCIYCATHSMLMHMHNFLQVNEAGKKEMPLFTQPQGLSERAAPRNSSPWHFKACKYSLIPLLLYYAFVASPFNILLHNPCKSRWYSQIGISWSYNCQKPN